MIKNIQNELFANLLWEVTGAPVVVVKSSGFSGWGEGFFGEGVAALTGGLVVGRSGLVVVLVITGGTVVWICGSNVVFVVVLDGTRDGWGGRVEGVSGSTGAAGVGTAGEIQKRRCNQSKI